MRPTSRDPAESYAEACAAEAKAWALVRDHQPGTPGHDPALWDLWRATVELTAAAKREVLQSLPPGRRSGEGSDSVLPHLAREIDFKPTAGGPGSDD